jgi:hypothetical protein
VIRIVRNEEREKNEIREKKEVECFAMKLMSCLLFAVVFSAACAREQVENRDPQVSEASVTSTPEKAVSPIASGVKHEWSAAVFEGLTIGKAKRDEFVALLGEPSSAGEISADMRVGAEAAWLDGYKKDDAYMEAWSDRRTKVVNTLVIYPKKLSVKELVQRYGNDFVFTRYESFDCPGDAGSSLIRESADGESEYMEFRGKGLAVTLDSQLNVTEIAFLDGPRGAKGCGDTK